MTREGHPLAAMLLLFSMFAFALVFHAVTQPAAGVPVRYDLELASFAFPIEADTPQIVRAIPVSAGSRAPVIAAVHAFPAAPAVSAAADIASSHLDAVAWPIVLLTLRTTVPAIAPTDQSREGGAVTRALATTASTLRRAFRKTF